MRDMRQRIEPDPTVLEMAEFLVRELREQIVVLRAERDEARRCVTELTEAYARLVAGSSVAERPAVNRQVAGSSPAPSATPPEEDPPTTPTRWTGGPTSVLSDADVRRTADLPVKAAARELNVGPGAIRRGRARLGLAEGGRTATCERCDKDFIVSEGSAGRFCSRECYENNGHREVAPAVEQRPKTSRAGGSSPPLPATSSSDLTASGVEGVKKDLERFVAASANPRKAEEGGRRVTSSGSPYRYGKMQCMWPAGCPTVFERTGPRSKFCAYHRGLEDPEPASTPSRPPPPRPVIRTPEGEELVTVWDGTRR